MAPPLFKGIMGQLKQLKKRRDKVIVDFSKVIRTVEGIPYKDGEKDFLLGTAAKTALDRLTNDEASKLSIKEKQIRGELMKKIAQAIEPLILESDEVVIIKNAINNAYSQSAWVVTTCCDLLEGKA